MNAKRHVCAYYTRIVPRTDRLLDFLIDRLWERPASVDTHLASAQKMEARAACRDATIDN
jgi:hypothetical protein